MKAILLRKVPDDIHKRLKAAAAMAGQSLQDFIVEILTREVKKAAPRKHRGQRGIHLTQPFIQG